MEEKGLELINSKEERDKNIGRVEVLDSVGNLFMLPNTELTTVKMVAEFYEVDETTITRIIKKFSDEVESDGYRLWSAKEIEEYFKNGSTMRGSLKCNDCILENVSVYKEGKVTVVDFKEEGYLRVSNRGKYLFTKRAVLRIGMLLRDSEVAKEVRNRLLDVYHDVEMGKENIIENVVGEIDEEKKLMLERVEAEFNGDLAKVCEINAKLFDLKNKRIKELEEESNYKQGVINGLTDDITLAEKRQRITQIVRKGYDNYGKRYTLLYKEFEKKYHMDLNTRISNAIERKEIKKNTSRMDYICDILNMTNELYEVCCKLFEGDYNSLLREIEYTCKK